MGAIRAVPCTCSGWRAASCRASTAPVDGPPTTTTSHSWRKRASACSALAYQSCQVVCSLSASEPPCPARCGRVDRVARAGQAVGDETHLGWRPGKTVHQEHARCGRLQCNSSGPGWSCDAALGSHCQCSNPRRLSAVPAVPGGTWPRREWGSGRSAQRARPACRICKEPDPAPKMRAAERNGDCLRSASQIGS